MRDILCVLLSLILFCSCVFAGGLPQAALLPPGREAAWWGLLFPGLFPGGGDSVIFDWPVLRRIAGLFA
ncbi:MAG: hypothetical protein IJ214_02260 [Clostridia bacterium]|nr:hypothetical protein [Clostridia bacterium]